jgi:hypothetical protein
MPAKTKTMPPIHPGETLRKDFLKPLGLTANRLATELFVPANADQRHRPWPVRGHGLALGSLLRNDAPILDQPPVKLRSRIGAGCVGFRDMRACPAPSGCVR